VIRISARESKARSMAFAATLITLDDPESDHRDHSRKAMAGAKNDPLLAQNLGSNFNRQTILSYWPTRRQGANK
jgi:hypothetical protein